MSDSLNLLIGELTAFGLLTNEALHAVLESLPEQNRPQSAEALSDLLIERDLLTPYQKQKLLAGSGKSLLMGNYLILDQLGKGGMGVVLKALHRRMDRLVALKVMAPGEVSSPDAVRRFHREVQAAARLTHPNIVIAYDADEADGSHFLVMEYVAGVDLHQHVQRHGPLSVESAVEVIIQAARGLEFSHQQGVIHRDIKPANLLLDARGTVKILDMGLARLDGSLGNSADGAGLTSTGTIMGTVDFMSPEQAIDTKHADARSDIYSLGCTFYYLVSRETLYQGDTLMKRLLAHQSAPIPPLLEQLPEEAQDELTRSRFENINGIFLRMVVKNPDNRYQTMTEVIGEMEQFLQTQEGASPLWKYRPSQDSGTPSFVLSTPSARKSGSHAAGSKLKTGGPQLPTVILAQQEPEETLIASGDAAPETIIQNGSPSSRSRKRTRTRTALAGGMILLLLVSVGGWSVLRTSEQKQSGRAETGTNAAVTPIESPDASVPVQASPRSESWTPTAEQQAFFDHVSTLSPEQQMDAVRKKMLEVNSGLKDSEMTYEIQGTSLESLTLLSDAEGIDLWPIHALPQLKRLSLRGASYTGRGEWRRRGVRDLSPLSGLSLKRLIIQGAPIQDLAPLRGLPLEFLDLDVTSFTSLEPLRDSPLISLSMNGTPASDLAPLRGIRLTALGCAFTQVSDLAPLTGMPLEILNLAGSKVTDLEPLRGAPLTLLDCRMLAISDFSPIQQAPLKALICSRIPPDQYSIIQQFPLERFECPEQFLPEYRSFLKRMPTLKLINQKPAQQVLDSLPAEPKKTASWIPTTEQQVFFDHVAVLLPEQQIEAVRKKMTEVNPGWDGNFTCLLGPRGVSEIQLPPTLDRLEIWPVRAFSSLVHFKSSPPPLKPGEPWEPRGVHDLSPLQGLPLTNVVVERAPLRSIAPLAGMPLTYLGISYTQVTDLSPIHTMPLGALGISGLPLNDFSELEGTQISELFCGSLPISDLSQLSSLPLTHLSCSALRISDLSPLQGKQLVFLDLNRTLVEDLSPLKGMKLETLNCMETKVSDLTPLAGMPLKSMNLYRTSISDLAPLQGAPLESINLNSTSVIRLDPLKDSRLKELHCSATIIPQNLAVLKQIPTLERINGKPTQEILEGLDP